MKRKFTIMSIALALLVSGPTQIVQADDDFIEARRLRESGDIMPLEEILKNVRRSYPGRILEVELENEKGRVIYELEILGADRIVREIYIDAKSGDLLSVEEDD